MRRRALLLGLALLTLVAWAQTTSSPGAEMARAASAFYDSLTPGQQQKVLFALDAPERTDWHYIPRPRPGVPFKEMTPEQRLTLG